jgi:uncharacterized membrane protein YeaQ/YmgE (transglycosylase-associated protein family)
MAENSLLLILFVGAVAGWLAGVIVKGYGFGLIGNIFVGIVGSLFGNWLFTHFQIVHGGGMIGDIVGATVGAVILLFLVRFVRRVA